MSSEDDTQITQKKINHLREWGHLVSIGIMILAMFAFGIHIEHPKPTDGGEHGRLHIKIRWEEVPAILIVFVLAEFGVVLVSAAMDVGASVQLAGSETKKAAGNAEKAANRITELTAVGDAANTALDQLKSALSQLSHSSKENIWEATAQFMLYSGIDHQECWASLSSYTRAWIPDKPGKDQGIPVGFLFRSFAGPCGGIRHGRNEVACATTDSAYMEASQKWLYDILSRDYGGVSIYAVTTLMPTDFALPHLWWEKNGKPYRVKVLDDFVSRVLQVCDLEQVDYKRVTVFNGTAVRLPEAQTLNVDLEDDSNRRVVNEDDLSRSLDEWFILDERLNVPNLPAFTNLVGNALAKGGLIGSWLNSALRWDKILEDLKITETNSKNHNWFSHTLPASDTVDYASFTFQEGPRRLLYFSEKALNTVIPFKIEDIGPSLSPRKEQLTGIHNQDGTLRQILQAFGYLSLRNWYCDKMHRPGGDIGAHFWEANDSKILEELSIDWDQERIPTLDLLLIGNKDKDHWFGAAIANLHMETPSCLVKVVTGQEELERIAQIASALIPLATPWNKFGKKAPVL
jgi:hypothetical protein